MPLRFSVPRLEFNFHFLDLFHTPKQRMSGAPPPSFSNDDLAWLRMHRTAGARKEDLRLLGAPLPPPVAEPFYPYPLDFHEPPVPNVFRGRLTNKVFMCAAFAELKRRMDVFDARHEAEVDARARIWTRAMAAEAANVPWAEFVRELDADDAALFRELNIGTQHHHKAFLVMRARADSPRTANCSWCLGTGKARIARHCTACRSIGGIEWFRAVETFLE